MKLKDVKEIFNDFKYGANVYKYHEMKEIDWFIKFDEFIKTYVGRYSKDIITYDRVDGTGLDDPNKRQRYIYYDTNDEIQVLDFEYNSNNDLVTVWQASLMRDKTLDFINKFGGDSLFYEIEDKMKRSFSLVEEIKL